MKLKRLTRDYINETDNSLSYDRNLTCHVRKFCEWHGRNIHARKLSVRLINEFVSHLLEDTNLSRETVRAYKGSLVTIWRYAGVRKLCEWPETHRLKQLKSELPPPVAWSKEEVHRVIASAAEESDHRYWNAWTRVAWDTGARKADIMDFTFVKTDPWIHRENKTGKFRRVCVRAETKEAFDLLLTGGRTLMWNRDMHTWDRHSQRIIKRAGCTGTMGKWMRKSYATHCPPGALGHSSPSIEKRHYRDPHQDTTEVPMP